MKEEVSENTNGEQSSNASPDANTSEAVAVTENGATDAGQNQSGVEDETNAEESAPVNETQNGENTENIEASDIQENGESTGNSETVEKEDAGPTEETSGEGAENEEKVTEENTERTTNEPTEVISDNANNESTDTTVNTATPTENGEVNASKPIIASEIMEEEVVEFPRERRLTAYERLSNDLSGDHKTQKEITLGKRIGFYRIRGELGSGNFSQVKMGIHALTKEKVAVKILDKTKLDQKTQRLLSREISSMDKMHHPNIIRLYEVVETLAKLHIVMEYAGGGELFHKISNEGKMPESEVKIIYAQVLAALEHMHSKNVIHRDLKAENVFYAGPRFVKVGDFGFSTCSPPDQTLNTFCGSPPYAAPELFKDEHYFGAFVDIWAMGIMLYFMVCGVMPFRADNVSKLKKAILEGHFVIPNFVSDSCQFLIRGILKPIPQDRFSLVEIQRSNFLEGQEFPEELPPYNMNPSGDGAELTEEEIETRSILHDLGITEAHIIECHGKDSRSSINGTYRIVLHKVQRKRSGRVIDNGPEFEVENTIKEEPKPPKAGKKSSICVIL